MAQKVLITGGMGFIGRHVAAELVKRGDHVRILDNFHDQVHGGTRVVGFGEEIVEGDIRDPAAVARALEGVDQVVHLAAEVGVGQSMYEIDRYVAVNDLGTAVLLQQMTRRQVRRIVVASSMSIYGEGLYRDADGALVQDARRRVSNGGSGFDPLDEEGRPLVPIATPETKQPILSSVYALTKYAQEQMVLIAAPAYGVEAVALRLFNVYGPGQALSNPYTGVLAIFASNILNGRPPVIFEDGRQRRDFVHVEDVARAFVAALDAENASGETINIGSGQEISISDLARQFLAVAGRPDLEPEITGKLRIGDIRHCFADIAKAEKLLGFRPRRTLGDALPELAEWVATQTAIDRTALARQELESRGLVA
jgi:dTDP-L-rhamnose 4-epimerase